MCFRSSGKYQNSPTTAGVIATVWGATHALGALVAPTLSGHLVDAYGFQWGTTILATCLGSMVSF